MTFHEQLNVCCNHRHRPNYAQDLAHYAKIVHYQFLQPLALSVYSLEMPHAPGTMVIAVGCQTEHWPALRDLFPRITNCCLDVRDAFHREWDESTELDGFDERTRARMKNKPAWSAVFAAALEVVRTFRVVVLVCNHGKHRSLSVAVELKLGLGDDCELVSPRDPKYPAMRKIEAFARYLRWHHCLEFMRPDSSRDLLTPVLDVRVGLYDFDADQWIQEELSKGGEKEGRCREWIQIGDKQGLRGRDMVHTIRKDDIMIVLQHDCFDTIRMVETQWSSGVLVTGADIYSRRWFPPDVCGPLPLYHFPHIRDFKRSLLQWCTPYSEDDRITNWRRNRN